MKTYIEQANGTIFYDGVYIPQGHRLYAQALEEVSSGEATIEAYAGSQREQAEIAREQAASNKKVKQQAKLEGVEFEGKKYSATKEDMWGLAAVKDWIRAGNSTKFEFDNGEELTLTPQNIDAFEAVWVPFRASFFE